MKNSSKLIDAHQHVFWHGRDDAGLVADMDEHGIAYSWLLTWEIHPTEHTAETNYEAVLNPGAIRADGSLEGIPLRDIVTATRTFPDRFVAGFCPHPLTGNAVARLRSAARIYDIKVCGEWKFRIPFDDPRCLELFRAAGEFGLPVVLHLDVPYLPDGNGGWRYAPMWYGGTVENLERALAACPDTIFVGHAPGFWREISADADQQSTPYPTGPVTAPGRLQQLLDRYENLWADLSAGSACAALKRDPAYARQFLEDYSGRLLFARDYYGGSLAAFLDSLELSRETVERIAWRNAERLVRPPTIDEREMKRQPLAEF